MNYRTRLFSFLLIIISILTVTSCKKKVEAESKKKIILGFSQIGAESEWRIQNSNSVIQAAAENDIQLLYENAQQKQENQLQAIRTFIVYQVDVIAFVPIVETGWDNVLQEAKDAGIPVIVVDRKINTRDPTLYEGFIGEDGMEDGMRAAEFLVKKYANTNETLNILELSGTEDSSIAYERGFAFRKEISKYPKFNIIHTECGDFLRSKGREIADKIISANGDLKINNQPIDIIFSHNDGMTWGFLDAMEQHKIDPTEYTIVTIDGEKKSVQAIADRKINCVVECNPNLGPTLIELVKQLFIGESIPPITFISGDVYSEFNTDEELEGKGF